MVYMNVHDEGQSEQPSVITDLMLKVDKKVAENRNSVILSLSGKFIQVMVVSSMKLWLNYEMIENCEHTDHWKFS